MMTADALRKVPHGKKTVTGNSLIKSCMAAQMKWKIGACRTRTMRDDRKGVSCARKSAPSIR